MYRRGYIRQRGRGGSMMARRDMDNDYLLDYSYPNTVFHISKHKEERVGI